MLRRAKRRAPEPPPSSRVEAYLPPVGRIVSTGLEDVGRSWRTRVEAVDDDLLVLVAPTRSRGEAILPAVSSGVLVGWAAEDGYFQAETTFQRAGQDTVATWVLAVRRIARLQRRSAFRIETTGSVTLRAHDGTTVDGALRNLSEGGLCCAVPRRGAPQEGTELEVLADLEELDAMTCRARVVRVSDPGDGGEVELGIAFVGLGEAQVEALRQYVFSEQLRRRRSLAGR